MTGEIDGQLLGIFVGDQPDQVHTERFGSELLIASVATLLAVEFDQRNTCRHGVMAAQAHLYFIIELGEACPDLPEQVAHFADPVLEQAAFFTHPSDGVHRRGF